MAAKKKYRGKCPKCKTTNVSSSTSFRCSYCGNELQLSRKSIGLRPVPETRRFPVAATTATVAFGLLLLLAFLNRNSLLSHFGPKDSNVVTDTPDLIQNAVAADGEEEALTPEQLFTEVSPSVATVVCLDEDEKPISSGSGFFVDFQFTNELLIEEPEFGSLAYLLTNHHVSRQGLSMEIRILNSAVGKVNRIIHESPKADLALLEVELKSSAGQFKTLPLSEEEITIGSTVFAVGSPHRLDQSFSKGMVSGKRHWHSSAARRVQTTSLIDHGSSGGPILNDAGKVVGVAVSGIDAANIDFFVPACSVFDMLARTIHPKVPSHGRSCTKEHDQTIERLNRSANSDKDSKSKVIKQQLILAAVMADTAPEDALKTLLPVLEAVPFDWKYFADYIAGRAYTKLATSSGQASTSQKTPNKSKTQPDKESDEAKKAIEFLKLCIDANPEFMNAHIELCRLLQKLGEHEEGLVAAREFAKSAPDCPDAHLTLGSFYESNERSSEALQSYANALMLNPLSERLQSRFIGFASREENAYSETVSFLTRATMVFGDQKGTWCFLLGLAYEEHGEFARAHNAYQQSIEYNVPFASNVLDRMEVMRRNAGDSAKADAE